MELEEIIRRLKGERFRITNQRLAICKFLINNRTHPSAEIIYKDLVKTNPKMSFATVYNTLYVLKKISAIKEIMIDCERVYYDSNTKPHIHLVCKNCKSIKDIFPDSDGIYDVFKEISNIYNVKNEEIEITLYGRCNECNGVS